MVHRHIEKAFRRKELSWLSDSEDSIEHSSVQNTFLRLGLVDPVLSRPRGMFCFSFMVSNEKGLISPSTAGAILQSRTNIKVQQASTEAGLPEL